MRLALISLLMIPLTLGCGQSCEEACDERLDDCREGGTPSTVCESQHKQCMQECENDEDDKENAVDGILESTSN